MCPEAAAGRRERGSIPKLQVGPPELGTGMESEARFSRQTHQSRWKAEGPQPQSHTSCGLQPWTPAGCPAPRVRIQTRAQSQPAPSQSHEHIPAALHPEVTSAREDARTEPRLCTISVMRQRGALAGEPSMWFTVTASAPLSGRTLIWKHTYFTRPTPRSVPCAALWGSSCVSLRHPLPRCR